MATYHYDAKSIIKALLVGSATEIFVTQPEGNSCCESMHFVGPVSHDSMLHSATVLNPQVIIISPSKQNFIRQIGQIRETRKTFIIQGVAKNEIVWSEALSYSDDLTIMPCDSAELCIRISKLMGSLPATRSSMVMTGDLTLDRQSYSVTLKGQPLDLAWKEYQLLDFLMQSPGKVFTRDRLLAEIWGVEYFGGTRTVDVHIRRLRQKLGAHGDEYFRTVKNVGYSFNTGSTLPKKRGPAG